MRFFDVFDNEAFEKAGEAAAERLASMESSLEMDAFDLELSQLFSTRAGRPKAPREPEMPTERPPEYEFLIEEMKYRKKQYKAMWGLGYRNSMDRLNQWRVETLEEELPFDQFCIEHMTNAIKANRVQSAVTDLPESVARGMRYERSLLEYALQLAMHHEEDATRKEFVWGVVNACLVPSPLSPDNVVCDVTQTQWRSRLTELAMRMSSKGGLRKAWGASLQEWLGDSVESVTEKLEALGYERRAVLCESRQAREEMYHWRGTRDAFDSAMQAVEGLMGTCVVDLRRRMIDPDAIAKHLSRIPTGKSEGVTIDELLANERADTWAGAGDIPLISELASGIDKIGPQGLNQLDLGTPRGTPSNMGASSEPEKRARTVRASHFDLLHPAHAFSLQCLVSLISGRGYACYVSHGSAWCACRFTDVLAPTSQCPLFVSSYLSTQRITTVWHLASGKEADVCTCVLPIHTLSFPAWKYAVNHNETRNLLVTRARKREQCTHPMPLCWAYIPIWHCVIRSRRFLVNVWARSGAHSDSG